MPVTTPSTNSTADPAAVGRARRGLIGTGEAERLAVLLGLLADPTRARVLFALGSVDELCVGDVAATLDISEDNATYALKVLRTAGLVRGRRDGRSVCYRLAEGFPHEMLEHCLKDLLAISPAAGPRTAGRQSAGLRAAAPLAPTSRRR